MNEILIKSKTHDYLVRFEPSLRTSLKNALEGDRNFLLVDRRVYDLFPNDFQGLFEKENIFTLEANETNKSYLAVAKVFDWLLNSNFRRDCKLIVVGGGITQDVGAFTANLLQRGIKWSFVPTTLLAQGDSCIGSKSSINFGDFKNQIGYFYPPSSVHICNEVLKTLSDDDWCSGIGEIVKLSLIDGEHTFKKTIAILPEALKKGPIINELVYEALKIKKQFIEADEFDVGVRRLLNFGHTFGHAYESATKYRIPHGVAVAMGMCSAAFISHRVEMMKESDVIEITKSLRPLFDKFLPELMKVNREEIFSALKRDKKNTKNNINCILLRGPGKLQLVPLQLTEQLIPHLNQFIDWIGRN